MKTYSRLTLAFLLLILVVPQVGADEPPENGEEVTVWSDSLGKFKVEADFVELVDGNLVVLKRASDGKIIKVPLDKLNEESKSQAKSLHAEAQPKQSSLDPAVEKQLEEMGLVRQGNNWRLKTDLEFDKLTRKVQSQLKSYVKSEKMKELSSKKEVNKKDKENSLAEKQLAAARAKNINQILPLAIKHARNYKNPITQKTIDSRYTPSKAILNKIQRDFNHGRQKDIPRQTIEPKHKIRSNKIQIPVYLELDHVFYNSVLQMFLMIDDDERNKKRVKLQIDRITQPENVKKSRDRRFADREKKARNNERFEENQKQRRTEVENLLNEFLIAHAELKKDIESINGKSDEIDKFLEGSSYKLQVPSGTTLEKRITRVEQNIPSEVLWDRYSKGIVFTWHKNGEKKSEGRITNDKKEGLWTEWYDNGQKEAEGNYKNDLQEGLWTEWYENGKKRAEYHYKNGKFEGLATRWYENGKKRAEYHYKNGKFEGLATTWHENGQKAGEAHYKNGKQEGLETWWYENGKKNAEYHYKNGKLVSVSMLKPDGEPCPITEIVDGSGIVVHWDENGKKRAETHYKNGKPEVSSDDIPF